MTEIIVLGPFDTQDEAGGYGAQLARRLSNSDTTLPTFEDPGLAPGHVGPPLNEPLVSNTYGKEVGGWVFQIKNKFFITPPIVGGSGSLSEAQLYSLLWHFVLSKGHDLVGDFHSHGSSKFAKARDNYFSDLTNESRLGSENDFMGAAAAAIQTRDPGRYRSYLGTPWNVGGVPSWGPFSAGPFPHAGSHGTTATPRQTATPPERSGGPSGRPASGTDTGAWGGRSERRTYNPGSSTGPDTGSGTTTGPRPTGPGSGTPGTPTPSGPSGNPPEGGGGGVTSTIIKKEDTGIGYAITEVLTSSSGATTTRIVYTDYKGNQTGVQVVDNKPAPSNNDSSGPGENEPGSSSAATSNTDSGANAEGEDSAEAAAEYEAAPDETPESSYTDDPDYEFQSPGGKADPDAPTSGGDQGNAYRFNPEVRATVQAMLRAKALSQAENPPGVGPGDPPPDMWTPFQGPNVRTEARAMDAGPGRPGILGRGRSGVQGYEKGDPVGQDRGPVQSSGDGGFIDNGAKAHILRASVLQQLRAGILHPWVAPGDPGPVDLRTARIVDSDAASGLVGGALSAHELSEQRIAPRARFARASRR